jgi:hypothetical protein
LKEYGAKTIMQREMSKKESQKNKRCFARRAESKRRFNFKRISITTNYVKGMD